MGFIRVISGDLVLVQYFIYDESVFFPIAIVYSFYLKKTNVILSHFPIDG